MAKKKKENKTEQKSYQSFFGPDGRMTGKPLSYYGSLVDKKEVEKYIEMLESAHDHRYEDLHMPIGPPTIY